MGLLELEKELLKELQLLEYPPAPWLASSKEGILDVAIIGGGMAGLAAKQVFAKKRGAPFTKSPITFS